VSPQLIPSQYNAYCSLLV